MTKEIHDINARAVDFVVELIEYIFEYPDDDYMTMECLCRKLVKHGLLDKADGYYQTHEIRTNTHECVKDTHDKTESNSEKPNNYCDDCLYTDTCDSKEFFYACTSKATISKMEQVDEPTEITYQNCSDALLKMWMDNVLTDAEYNRIMDKLNKADRKDEPQIRCPRCGKTAYIRNLEKDYGVKDSNYKYKCINCNTYIEDEPQTDTEIAKAIVHKMIDDAVLAEDAYPDLRQKMHDAVDEYEPQTDCPWK